MSVKVVDSNTKVLGFDPCLGLTFLGNVFTFVPLDPSVSNGYMAMLGGGGQLQLPQVELY